MNHDADPPLPSDFQAKDVVAFYNAQNAALNQLWAMYVVATFTAGAFAVAATPENSRTLLLAGGIGFLMFTSGHMLMIIGTLKAMQAGAADLERATARPDGHSSSLLRLAKGPKLWGAILVHSIIDLCVVSAYVFLILRVTAW